VNVPSEILELVERFESNRDAYLSGAYNETQIRLEFIDPFFKALGWDVHNEQGYAEAYKDVIHEDAIKVGGATKAPDYCFRIGGTRMFFVEAKKPSVNLKDDISPAFQLRRYAWSAKLPLSILTDFEEFAVYDCRVKPVKTDKASTARTLYLTYEDYENRWDEIASVFSKEAVFKGSFDKYVESKKLKRGTAEVDDAFLEEIESWRELLARNIALRNSGLTRRELNYAVQRTIDRIVFLRICEDRGIEDYGKLMALLNGNNVYPRLFELFRKADERYNSGLFHFKQEKDRPESPDGLTPNLIVDDKSLKSIIRDIYYPESPYEFSVLPADILGHVYEQFLGKVIRLTPKHRAVVEDKPEVKKAGGVYYTPTFIVDYIVENTVGELLEGKSPKQAAKLRILDPACGSGSFLLGAYQYLLDWHRDLYVADDPKIWAKGRNPKLYQGSGGSWRLTTGERKRILLNNIYGVDIDPQAVEVTKLSLLLKVLEGESDETLASQMKLFHERALPDLGENIKCGNSLIGSDYLEGKEALFLDEEVSYKINTFDWDIEFPKVMNASGFDAIIGNPPYGAVFPEETHDYFKSKYQTFVWRGESYLVFVEKSIGLLKKGGQFGYIIPDTYLNLGFTQHLRTYILQNTKLREIVSLPSRVFKNSTVDTTLLFTTKEEISPTFIDSDIRVRFFNKKATAVSLIQADREFLVSSKTWYEQGSFNVLSDTSETDLVVNIENQHKRISELAEMFYGIKVYQIGKGKPPQTKEIRDTKPFTSERKENKQFLPFFKGKHIGRYSLLWEQNNWLDYGPWVAEPREPVKFEGEKILIRKIAGKTLIATYVPETSYCNTLLYVLKLESSINISYKYLLGILNSNLIGWYFRKKFQISSDDTFPQIMIGDISQFPVPVGKKETQEHIGRLVERLLDLHKMLANVKASNEKTVIQRQIQATDRQIDKLVYELYGLTDDEIQIVENAD